MNTIDNAPVPPTQTAPPAAAPRWAGWWLSALTILILGLLMGLGMNSRDSSVRAPENRPDAPAAPPRQPPPAPRPGQILEGPWGRLEIVPITIAPPAELLWQMEVDHSGAVTWHFPKMSPSRLNDKLIELGLPDSVRAALRAQAKRNRAIDGCTILPDREFVLGLAAEVRAKLYVLLHHFAENRDQVNAFRFCGASPEAWFADSPLLPETKRLVAPLIYRDGTFLFFADLRSVQPSLPADEERIALIRALSRESTILLRLQVSEKSDVESLVGYWGRGGRNKEVRPILDSLSRIGGRQSLDVTQLLPPFARQRIYTYPIPRPDDVSVKRDCYWTAMNFFSEQPDDRLGNVDKAFETLKEDYYRVHGNPQFGDLVFYLGQEREPIHAAVYIAADILFTKNGPTVARPWMFLKTEDMKHFYPRTNKQVTLFFRRKGF